MTICRRPYGGVRREFAEIANVHKTMNKLIKIVLSLVCGVLVSLSADAGTVRGTVSVAGRPLAEVIVSDGVRFARTSADGSFSFETAGDAPFIWVVTPSGYVASYGNGSPRFYLPVDGRECYDFELQPMKGGYTLLAVGDPQPKTNRQFKRLVDEVVPEWKKMAADIRTSGGSPVMLVLGDIVWDSPQLAEPMRKLFAELDMPVYTVIGNHDHLIAVSDDAGSAVNYCAQFGPTYYAFDLGDSHFIVLDDIVYHGEKIYEEAIDERQLTWLGEYVKMLPAGSRLCIAMHAPFQKYWKNFTRVGGGDRLLKLTEGFEVHFITGHTHINSNLEITPAVMEHNVAQIAGNLWHAPLNNDGTPRGYQLFTEEAGGLRWYYKTLDKPLDYQMKLYAPGRVESHPQAVMAKIWNWDANWTVEWREDGNPRGAMTRYEATPDPDYIDHLERVKARAEATGKRISKAEMLRRSFFYFGAEPSVDARVVEVMATDRFGNRYTQKLKLKK